MIKAIVSTVLIYFAFNFCIGPYFQAGEISWKMAAGIGCIIGLVSSLCSD